MMKITMKNRLTALALCGVLIITVLTLILINANSNKSVKYNTIAADRVQLASTFEEVEAVSDLIVSAIVNPNKETVRLFHDGLVHFGFTITELTITDVFKGELRAGDTIKITEEYFTITDSSNEIYKQGGYMPANGNSEYIFFLKSYAKDNPYAGMHYPVDLEFGKYSINLPTTLSSRVSSATLEITSTSFDRYVEFAQKVSDKYLLNNN